MPLNTSKHFKEVNLPKAIPAANLRAFAILQAVAKKLAAQWFVGWENTSEDNFCKVDLSWNLCLERFVRSSKNLDFNNWVYSV